SRAPTRCRAVTRAPHLSVLPAATSRSGALPFAPRPPVRQELSVFRTSFAFLMGACLAASASAHAQTVKPVWPDEGPFKWAPRPTSAQISANDLRTRLYQFSDDSMQGRRIGEPGNFKGTDYIAREFKRMGLKPGGDNGTYFQVMPFGPLGYDSSASR